MRGGKHNDGLATMPGANGGGLGLFPTSDPQYHVQANVISWSGTHFKRCCSALSRRGDFDLDVWRRGCSAAPVNKGNARFLLPDGVTGGRLLRFITENGKNVEGPGAACPRLSVGTDVPETLFTNLYTSARSTVSFILNFRICGISFQFARRAAAGGSTTFPVIPSLLKSNY